MVSVLKFTKIDTPKKLELKGKYSTVFPHFLLLFFFFNYASTIYRLIRECPVMIEQNLSFFSGC